MVHNMAEIKKAGGGRFLEDKVVRGWAQDHTPHPQASPAFPKRIVDIKF